MRLYARRLDAGHDALDIETCECCGQGLIVCDCPECPYCGSVGDKRCYEQCCYSPAGAPHAQPLLSYSKKQLIGQVELHIARLEDRIADDRAYISWLDTFNDDLSKGGQS